MIETETQKEPLRYRLYYRLMDICLIATVFFIIEIINQELGGAPDLGLPGPFAMAFTAWLIVFVFIGPFFLLIAKFMRDDYAEQLWKRTVVVLAYGMGLLPVALFIGFNTAMFVFGDTGAEETYHSLLVVEWQVSATIYVACLIYMLLFVFIFQFLRWRDSG